MDLFACLKRRRYSHRWNRVECASHLPCNGHPYSWVHTNNPRAQLTSAVSASHAKDTLRIAAVADLHCTKAARGRLSPLFQRMSEEAEVMLLGGDLTDYGLPDEALVLAQELKVVRQSRIIAVLGNHDYHSDKQQEVKNILSEAGVTFLDGDSLEIRGVGFTGVKGYLGGFDSRMLQAWGEPGVKAIVHEAMEESLKLETGLARLRSRIRIVLLHYAPVRATVLGEPPELYPFLGSSRMEEALHRHPVTAVFHGHAHYGSPEGKTSEDIPVYNVALPLLLRLSSGRNPFRRFEVKIRADHAK